MLYADASVPEREIVEMLAHEGKLARTTRIYAKYDPTRLASVTRSLTTIWAEIRAMAKAYGSDHELTTTNKNKKIVIAKIGDKA